MDRRRFIRKSLDRRIELLAIGGSHGGMEAVSGLLSGLGKDIRTPMAVVLHRAIDSYNLSGVLQRHTTLRVLEPDDKQEIQAGTVYLAPPDYHLIVERGYFSFSLDDRVCGSRPSIDILFRSAAENYGSALVGVLLSGANTDGVEGLAAIKDRGGITLVQNPDTAECDIMPRGAIDTNKVDVVCDLHDLALLIQEICKEE